MVIDRFVLVTKSTRLEELVEEHLTEGAARFVVESEGESFDRYLAEHERYHRSLDAIFHGLPPEIALSTVTRRELPDFLFRENDLVIVCGPDGLFVNLAQYVGGQPVLGINPDPETIAGNLMPFSPREVDQAIERVASDGCRYEALPFVKAATSQKQVVWGINDVFLGRLDQVSARYRIAFGSREERHSSSGVIVSTGLGANAWLRSIVAMVEGITDSRREHALFSLPRQTERQLVFVVREPFPSPQTGAEIVTGRITHDSPLTLVCEMPRGGVIFSDGVVERAVEWSAGTAVRLSVGERTVRRVLPLKPGK